MMEMQITPATVIVGAVIIALVILAVRRLLRRGTCDSKACSGGGAGCAGCGSIDKMVADMEKAAKAGKR